MRLDILSADRNDYMFVTCLSIHVGVIFDLI